MKNKLRIKILQENEKLKNLRKLTFATETDKSFEINKAISEKNKKCNFLNHIIKYL